MPLNRYFKKPGQKSGKGQSVMKSMQRRYGKKKGKSIFYATVNKAISGGTKKQKAAQPKGRPGAKRKTKTKAARRK